MKMLKNKRLETICPQADHPEKDPYGSHLMPVYQTSTFAFPDAESGRRFFAHEDGGASHSYSRLGNPTVEKLEGALTAMETANLSTEAECMFFSSGMAAITTAFLAIGPGKTLIAQETLYGCTSQFLSEEAEKFGIHVIQIDSNDPKDFIEAIEKTDDLALLFFESIANPTLTVFDMEPVVRKAHEKNALVMVDNTFATPWHIQPFKWDCDIVAHSTTKYINGHGSSIGGALIMKDPIRTEYNMDMYRKNHGGTAGPFDAWLTLLGLKTFPLRMKKHAENAASVAGYLDNHDSVEKVCYPGLASNQDHQLAKKYMEQGYGGMVSFELKGGFEAGKSMMDHVKLCTLAVSLGNVDTLIQHPASMTHAVMSPEARERNGITDGLVRLSVGTEAVDDIVMDLEQALSYTLENQQKA